MSLTTSFEPTPGTVRRWTTPLVKHALNMELVLMLGSIVSFFLALANGLSATVKVSTDYDDFVGGFLFAVVMPAPVVTFFITLINITLFRRSVMHPVANLILSIILLLGWAATAAFLALTGLFSLHQYYWDPYPFSDHDRRETISVITWIVFGSECVMGVLYFASVIVASVGVQRWRTTKYRRFTAASGVTATKTGLSGEVNEQVYVPAEEAQEGAGHAPNDKPSGNDDHGVKFTAEAEKSTNIPWPSSAQKHVQDVEG